MDISKITKEEVAAMIDHTKLKAHETQSSIKKLCREAIEYKFASVCVNSSHAAFVSEMLKGTGVKTCCVVGFPLGAMANEIKAVETEFVVKNGAEEVDMVINVGALKEKRYDYVLSDIKGIVKAAKGNPVKVILETGLLTDDEKVKGCEISKEAKAHFVKTSTGMGPYGALPHDIKIMRETVGGSMGVKASGGVTDFRRAMKVIEAGANRIGTSSGIQIVESIEWAKYSKAWFIDEIPCWICPSAAASMDKQPSSVYKYYIRKCTDCAYREYRRFNDF